MNIQGQETKETKQCAADADSQAPTPGYGAINDPAPDDLSLSYEDGGTGGT